MPHWISTFRNYIESLNEQELTEWLLDGLNKLLDDTSKSYMKPWAAFKNTEYAFGQRFGRDSTENELACVFEHLKEIKPQVAKKVLTDALDSYGGSDIKSRQAYLILETVHETVYRGEI